MSWKKPVQSVAFICLLVTFFLFPSVALPGLFVWMVLVAASNRHSGETSHLMYNNIMAQDDEEEDPDAPASSKYAALKRQYLQQVRGAEEAVPPGMKTLLNIVVNCCTSRHKVRRKKNQMLRHPTTTRLSIASASRYENIVEYRCKLLYIVAQDEEEEDPDAPASNNNAALKPQYLQIVSTALDVQNLLDDVANFMERMSSLQSWMDPMATMIFMGVMSGAALAIYMLGLPLVLSAVSIYVLRPPAFRDPEPTPPEALYSRLPVTGGFRVYGI
eukprot:gene6445-3074_t